MKSYFEILLFGFIVLALFVGCAQQQKEQDIAKVREEISLAWKQFAEAWVKGDAAAAAGFYTEDGVNIPNDAPDVRGRSEIQKSFSYILSQAKRVDFSSKNQELDICKDTVFDLGTFTDTFVTPDGNKTTFKARYMCVWKRQSDGTWKIHRFIFNSLPAS